MNHVPIGPDNARLCKGSERQWEDGAIWERMAEGLVKAESGG